MSNAQKKIIFGCCLVLSVLTISAVFRDWIWQHREAWKWAALALMLIVGALSQITSTPARIPSYAERHREFNRLTDEHPWVKFYVAAILLVEAIGFYLYATSEHVDAVAILDKVGLLGLLGALLLVFLPLIVIRLSELHDDSGR